MSKTIYVSYATPDYMPRLTKMVRSLMKVGIPKDRIDACQCSIKGNWDTRVKAKIDFMRQKAEEYPDRNIAWIDADAEVVQFPEFYENFTGEWGMAKEPRHGRYGNWYLSNAYIIYPTEKVKQFLGHWEYHTLHIRSRTPTQTAFNQAWEIHQPRLKLNYIEQPLSYSWYEKHKNRPPYNKIKPVIIHDIASRVTLSKRGR